ncbi:MAG: DUF896 domain-containing protein [Oscillospiraceae bacterium]|nr:DUF896 domain-containing protein [Oscillospiraceae bacterium]
MKQEKIDRINTLAKKHKTEGLTPEETAERETLHKEYVAGVRKNLTGQLENTYVMDEQGNKQKLKQREE